MKKVPKLRFKEFNNEWEEKKLGDFITINGRIGFRGYTVNDIVDSKEKGAIALSPTNLLENKIYFSKLTYISNFKYEESPEIKLQIGDILLVKTGSSYGKVGFLTNLPWKATINPQLVIIKTKLNKSFLYYFMNTFIFQKQIEENIVGGAIPTLSQESIKKFKFFYTMFQEQEKIANFLSSVDKKISLTEEKLNLFKEYKKGIMQKIFSQELRFKDSNGNNYPNWEEKKLGDIFDRVIDKNKENNTNILTISAQYGLISQTDFFNKSIAGKDLSKYYLLKKDDFAYNKSYSNGYPFGAIKKLKKYEKGVVSTLYICFRLKDKTNDVNFFEQFFETKKIDKVIQNIAQEGARNHGLLNISISDFFDINLFIPCLEEQKKIADLLSSIDNKIEKIENEVENLKEFKKGLLQQMFI